MTYSVTYLVILFDVVTRSALMRCSFIITAQKRFSAGSGTDDNDDNSARRINSKITLNEMQNVIRRRRHNRVGDRSVTPASKL